MGVIEVQYNRTELGKKQETQNDKRKNNPKLRASEFRLSTFYGAPQIFRFVLESVGRAKYFWVNIGL